jgi:hypothetical protein
MIRNRLTGPAHLDVLLQIDMTLPRFPAVKAEERRLPRVGDEVMLQTDRHLDSSDMYGTPDQSERISLDTNF